MAACEETEAARRPRGILRSLFGGLFHFHDWGRWGAVRTRTVQHRGPFEGELDGPPFQVHTQERACETCGLVRSKRVWL